MINSISLPKEDPAPYGQAIRNGELWCCNIPPVSGICRVDMKKSDSEMVASSVVWHASYKTGF